MKNYLLLLFFISTHGFAQWNLIQTFPATGNNIGPYALDYTKDSAIFITTNKSLLYSKNAGASFNTLSSFNIVPANSAYAAGRAFESVSFLNKDTGLISGYINNSGYDGLVQYSTGSFTSWNIKSPLNPSASNEMTEFVQMLPGKKSYAMDRYGHLFKSNNGINWQLKNSLSPFSLIVYEMCFTDSLHGFFFSSIGNYQTSDGGTSFQQLGALPAGAWYVTGASFINHFIGYIIASTGGYTKIFKTTDGGNTWNDVLPGSETFFTGFNDISFASPDSGFAITDNEVLSTHDGGNTWYRTHFSNSYDLVDIDFISPTQGVLTSTDYISLLVYKYNPASSAKVPYAPFNFQQGYCCGGEVCNIVNYGSTSWSYEWKINNIVYSTDHTPTSLVLPNIGYNQITLVAKNGIYKDSLERTVYNAAALTPGTVTCGLYDTAICLNSALDGWFTNTNTQYSYYMLDATGTQITSTVQGTPGGNVNFITTLLNAEDSVVTMVAQSSYPNCPGNTYSTNLHVNFYAPLPDTLLRVLADSICPGDSARLIFGPLKSYTYYSIAGSAYPFGLASLTSTDGAYVNYTLPMHQQTETFHYGIQDAITNCTLSQSLTVMVTVDSIHAILSGPPVCFVGDTLVLTNNSVATHYNWSYSQGLPLLSNDNYTVKIDANSVGEHAINMVVTNNTGCRDSIDFRIGIYEPMQYGSGNVCFSDTTFLPETITESSLKWYTGLTNHIRLHVDLDGNYYLTRNVFYGNPAVLFPELYGMIGFQVTKYDRHGNLKWSVGPNLATSTIGPSNEYVLSTVSSITSDPYGNVYFAGNFRGDILRIGSLGKLYTYSGGGVRTHGYVAKLDSNGICKWIMPMLEHSNIPGYTVASIGNLEYENQNSIYFNASKMEEIRFPPFTNVAYDGAHHLVQINANGNFKKSNLTHSDQSWLGYSILTAPSGYSRGYAVDHKTLKYKGKVINVNITRSPSVTLSNSQTINSNGSSCYAYVVVTDTMGAVLSSFKPMSLYGAGISPPESGLGWEYMPQIAVDKDGYFYFSWGFPTQSAKWYITNGYNSRRDTIILSDGTVIEANDQMTVLEKFDLNGTLLWHNKLPYFNTNSLVANNDGNIYGLGEAYSYAGLQSTDGHSQLISFPDTSKHALLYSYDPSGQLRWGKSFQTSKHEYPKEI